MTAWMWLAFVVYVVAMLAIDLGLLNRRGRVISTRVALAWSTAVALQAVLFSGLVYYLYENRLMGLGESGGQRIAGLEAAQMFLLGWIIEQSLSMDNIFVIAMIFAYFQVPLAYQHRTLFLGILGALVFRGLMIWAGAELIHRFSWIETVFGVVLLITAIKMLRTGDDHVEPDRNPLVRLARRLYPVSPGFDGERFFTRVDGRKAITPLFLALLAIETTDVIFAVDSIPAIFVITNDPFIVFTSNVFAILNLRSLYFVLSNLMDKFQYLKFSLVLILLYIGIKMLLPHDVRESVPTWTTLVVVLTVLLGGVLASLAAARRNPPSLPRVLEEE